MPGLNRRLFLALPTPEETRAALGRWTGQWRGPDDGWRWVEPAGIHLTLRFYGATPPAGVPPLVERLRAAAAAARPFDLTVVGWGVFPAPARPRVLWAGVTGDLDQLGIVARTVEEDARTLGFAAERRSFHPHVTLARATQGRKAARLPGRPDRAQPCFGPLPVRTLVLFESHLGPQGARYEAIAGAEIGSGETTGD